MGLTGRFSQQLLLLVEGLDPDQIYRSGIDPLIDNVLIDASWLPAWYQLRPNIALGTELILELAPSWQQ